MKHFNIWGWMEKADAILLNKFQKLSDGIQLNVGINCFGMARLLLFLFLLATVVTMVAFGKLNEMRSQIWIIAIFVYYYVRMELGIKGVEATSANPVFSNPNAYEFARSRQFLLLTVAIILPLLPFIAPLLAPIVRPIGTLLFGEHKIPNTIDERLANKISGVGISLQYVLIMIAMYFMCCNPKPPGESRLAKYIRSKSRLKTYND